MELSPESFLNFTLRHHSWGDKVARILYGALDAVDPDQIIRNSLRLQNGHLLIGDQVLSLEDFQSVYIIGIGKASLPMTAAALDILSNYSPQCIVLTKNKDYQVRFISPVKIFLGGHPVPTDESLIGAQAIVKTLSNLSSHDLVLVLLSGGGSSLFALPAEGISLDDLSHTNQILLSCGAAIQEINTIRKHISSVKGGQLARAVYPARIITLILSDVMGNYLDMVASGPTAPDPTNFAAADQIIQKYQLHDQLPASITNRIKRGLKGEIDENPKPGETLFKRVTNLILASNQNALIAAVQTAKNAGFNADTLPFDLDGEASLMGKKLAKTLQRLANQDPLPRPAMLVGGGETTVKLSEDSISGKGGRNLETALSALKDLDGLKEAALITLASDGEDGLTGAAGGIVTGDSYQRAIKLNLDPENELKKHNSYRVFDDLDDLIQPGPTGTNVNDLCFLFTF